MSSDFDLIDFRRRLAETLGWKAYNRLVASISDVRERGRLRFWQEQLLRQVSDSGLISSNAEEFIRIFDGASPIPGPVESWTRELFIRQIEEFPNGGFSLHDTPPEWMTAAWEIERVREELSSEMARTVSEHGEITYEEEYLQYFSRSLPIFRQLELFLYIRNRNPHREDEFRPGFEKAFATCIMHLPPPLTEKQKVDMQSGAENVRRPIYAKPDQSPSKEGNAVDDSDEQIPF